MRPIIKVENLGKRYRIGSREPYLTLRESLMQTVTAPARWVRRSLDPASRHAALKPRGEYVDALDSVSFDVYPGEVLGIIGRNGAGKSTLLKILSRITEPTTGQAELYGRVGSLLEVGTGFHPELSGRDNIYLSGAILGMRRAEIARKFDEIVAFAEVDRFVDTPVKYYSSGMYVRLAFGVAAHLEPEILLVDEVLAVGDAAFQRRCLGKMGDVARTGRTVIFVSHNMASIESLCRSCILLSNGKLEARGEPSEVVGRYLASDLAIQSGEQSLVSHPGRMRGSVPTMTSVALYSNGDESCAAIRIGDPLSIRVSYVGERPLLPFLGVALRTIQGAPVFAVSERFSHQLKDCTPATSGTVVCRLDSVALIPGTYVLDLYLGDAGNDFDRITDAIRFEVLTSDALGTGRLPPSSFGPMFCVPSWSLVAG